MKTLSRFHRKAQLFLALALLALPSLSRAAAMNDYCIVPPFIGKTVAANLLLMVDNSSSMWDLSYADEGNKDASGTITRQPFYCYDETYKSRACNNNGLQSCAANADCGTGKFCSNNSQQSCTQDTDCSSGNTCITKACVANSYAGYFSSNNYYSFNFTNNYFETAATFPLSASCSKFVAGTLCIGINASNRVDFFVASGNYLNWLTASKFDVEKQILTGGKDVGKLCYASGVATDRACAIDDDCASGQSCTAVTGFLQAESRGCVGQGFIKTALTANFVNFTGTPDPNNGNKLGVTFSIRGPVDSANPSAPSRGGQSYIDIYKGTYNNQLCQDAINNYYDTSASQTTLSNSVQACLNYNPQGANYCSGDHALTCTTDADCLISTVARAGGCSLAGVSTGQTCATDADCKGVCASGSNAGNLCTADIDCGTTQHQGHCDNQIRICYQNSDCTIGEVQGTCSSDSDNAGALCRTPANCPIVEVMGACSAGSNAGGQCTTNADCPVPEALGACSNTGVQCRPTDNCNVTAVESRCSEDNGTRCYSAAACPRLYCSGKTSATCSIEGASCGTDNRGVSLGTCTHQTCPGGAAGSTGSCQGYTYAGTASCTGHKPAGTGSCDNYNPGSAGNCVDAYTSQNSCSKITSHCDSPTAQPATTTHNEPCINPSQSGVVKTKIAFSETIQTCWTYLSRGQAIATGDYNRLISGNGKCDDVYKSMGGCSADSTRSCAADTDCSGFGTCKSLGVCSADTTRSCMADTDCSAGGFGTCSFAPAAILHGNPALICGNEYLGRFCTWNAGTRSCAWDTSNQSNIITAYQDFCNAQQPAVIDSTDSAASSTNFEQLPSLLGGIGVEAQLGGPIGTLPVRVKDDATACATDANCLSGSSCISSVCVKTGLIQEFGGRIRIGAMGFRFNGSKSEASSGAAITLPRVCSNDHSRLCTLNEDCPGSSCLTTSDSAQYNFDGGQIAYGSYIGEGKCATRTGAACTSSAQCTGGNICIGGECGTWQTLPVRCATDSNCNSGVDRCIGNGVGSHTTGLVSTIDTIRANAWTPFSEAFYNAIGYFARTTGGTSRTDLRINSADFDANLNPSQYRCQQNYILLITDGSSTADQNTSVQTLASSYSTAANPYASTPTNWNSTCPGYAGSTYLPILSWIAKNRNIADFSATPVQGRDNISTYVVFTGGSNGLSGECNSTQLMADTAKNGGTTLKQANKPQDLSKELRSVFEELAAKSASGTAASILSNSEGSGANILQAIFFPRKIFDRQTEASWLGELNNLWYYVDPYIGNSSMREDTDLDSALKLRSDNVIQFWFDAVKGETKVNLLQDTNGDGSGDTAVAGSQGISPDQVKSLWRAGRQLWSRDLTTAPRRVLTPCLSGGTSATGAACAGDGIGLMKFSYGGTDDNSAVLRPYLQAANDTAAVKLMKYVHGFDYPGDSTVRSRTVKIGNIPSAELTDAEYTSNPRDKGIGVWKLGDIVSSTPRLQSSVRQNAYNLAKPAGYGDPSYGDDAGKTGYIYTNAYRNRGMVYVGANDGMLHAFKLGTLDVTPAGDLKATLSNSDPGLGRQLGDEMWSFVPRNVLPYLAYYAEPDYGHLYFADGSSVIVDASVGYPSSGCDSSTTKYWDCVKDKTSGTGSNWRSILVGGMGTGGASRIAGAGCGAGNATPTCVETPIKDPADNTKGLGYSSYYALDVTDPADPHFLWEFADPGLGFATSGAAIVKISARTTAAGVTSPDKNKNGRWFAVFGSGPVGPIDTSTNHSFMGTSDQPLKVYVVDLNARHPLVTGDADPARNNYWVISDVYDGGTDASATIAGLTPAPLVNAFTGSMINATIDADRWNVSATGNYQDDALYFGYTQKDSVTGTWTKGGVLKLVTGEDPNPSHWKLVKVFDGVGPVSTAIARLQDRKNHFLWLYFGTGRYYYFQDDFNNMVGGTDYRRKLYGIKEPCYRDGMNASPADTLDQACAVKHSGGQETDQTNADQAVGTVGWSIKLDGMDESNPDNKLGAERVITDPVAMTNGAVFFTSYKPNWDLCQFGGNSYIWAAKYDSGTQPPAESLKGKALVQVSTGEFKEIDLATALTDKHNRRMSTPMTGKPPLDPPPIVSKGGNKPVKRIIHIQER